MTRSARANVDKFLEAARSDGSLGPGQVAAEPVYGDLVARAQALDEVTRDPSRRQTRWAAKDAAWNRRRTMSHGIRGRARRRS